MEREIIELSNAIYCLVEAMGMQSENMNRQNRGEAMAFTEEDFDIILKKWRV